MSSEFEEIWKTIHQGALDPRLAKLRKELALYSSKVFLDVGTNLHALGHIVGSDRKDGKSPFGHGNDEVVGMSVLLRMGSQLISASTELLTEGRPYAGAALLRQIVEIEYLVWAFESRDKDAELWLRSDQKVRETFFRPAKLRAASKGRFRSKDYGFHCELGGHPVPTGTVLLSDEPSRTELLLSDLLGHVGRIWDHFIGWAKRHENYTVPFKNYSHQMAQRFGEWKSQDLLTRLPPP